MTAARRLAAILAADVVGASRLMGEDEAGTAKAVREHREAAHPITLKANYGFPATATSTVTIFNDRVTSTPAVPLAQIAVISQGQSPWRRKPALVLLTAVWTSGARAGSR